jgi:hypothetical protein
MRYHPQAGGGGRRSQKTARSSPDRSAGDLPRGPRGAKFFSFISCLPYHEGPGNGSWDYVADRSAASMSSIAIPIR